MGGFNVSVPKITWTGTAGSPTIQNAAAANATLNITGSSASNFNGVIMNGTGGGTLGLTVSGSGSLALSGVNLYTGDTNISGGGSIILSSATNNISGTKNINLNNGTLNVSGITSGFTLSAAQTLSGVGTVTGPLNAAGFSTINPGINGVGTLNVSALTLNANSILNFQLGGTANNLISVLNANGLTLNGCEVRSTSTSSIRAI